MKKILLMAFVALMAFATSSCVDEHEDYTITWGSEVYGDLTPEVKEAWTYLDEVFDETFQNSGYEVMSGTMVLRDSNMKKASKIAQDLANRADSKVDRSKIEVLKTTKNATMRVRVHGTETQTAWEKDYAKE